MYQEEEMQQTMDSRPVTEREWKYVHSRLDYMLTQQQQMAGRLEALEHPLAAFEGGDREPARDEEEDRVAECWEEYQRLQERYSGMKQRASELEDEVKRLRSRLSMMQAGYNAIATIQARLDANEREMEGRRCCTG